MNPFTLYDQIPEGDDVCIVGTRIPQGSPNEKKRECERCHTPVYVSGKNARQLRFVCYECIVQDLIDDAVETATTRADIEEMLEMQGLAGWDVDAALKHLQSRLEQDLKRRKR